MQEYLKKQETDWSNLSEYLKGAEDHIAPKLIQHCWDVEGKVYVATEAGAIVRLDPEDGKVLCAFSLVREGDGGNEEDTEPGLIVFMDVIIDYMIVVTSKGKLIWFNLPEHTMAESFDVKLSPEDHVASASLTPSRAKLILGTDRGAMYDVRAYVDDDEKHSTADVTKIGQYHGGAVLGSAMLTPLGGTRSDCLLATAGDEGEVYLWSVANSKLAKTYDFFENTAYLNVSENGELQQSTIRL